MGIDVSKLRSTLVEQLVGFSSEKIYPNNFLSAKVTGEGSFGRNINDGFGASIAISENYAVVGVPNQSYDYQGENMDTGSGAAYIYERDSHTWVFLQKISIPTADRATANSFGYAVAVDGSTVVIGAPGVSSNKGAAYIYQFAAKDFQLSQKIVPTGTNAVGSSDKFGSAVSIKNDMIIVGAPNQNYDSTGTNGLSQAGAAWVFVYDDLSLVWNQVQKLSEDGTARNQGDALGTSCASTDSYLVVGAPGNSYTDYSSNYVANAGAAYVWFWSSVENNWVYSQKITPAKRATSAAFGASVAIDGTTIVVGSTGYTDNSHMMGAISIFELQNNSWVETAFFQPNLLASASISYNYTSNLNISFASAISIKGNSIAVSIPGAPLAISGSSGSGGGAVAVYTKTTAWNISQVIANPHYGTALITASDNFGYSVDIGTDSMIIGFPSDSYDATNTNTMSSAGSAYLYSLVDGVWTLEQKITGWGQDRNSGDYLGASIWYQDGYAFVGVPGYSYDASGENYLQYSGAVLIWQWNGSSWSYIDRIVAPNRHASARFGSTISGDTGIVAIGAPSDNLNTSNSVSVTNAGSVFIFNETNGSWSFTQEIVASSRNTSDSFGSSISISGSDLVVGLPGYTSSTGAAEFFSLTDGSWTFVNRVVAGDNAKTGDEFGYSVSINSGVAVIGAPNHGYDSDGLHYLSQAGAAWIFTKDSSSGQWTQTTKITGWGQDRNASDNMGWSIASDNGTLVVGVPNHSYDANGRNYIANAGSVLVYIWYNGGWFFQQKLVAQTNRLASSLFGYDIGISGDTLVIGAPGCGTYGSSYVFDRSYGVWTQTTELVFSPFISNYTSLFSTSASYGASVAIDGNYIVIGYPFSYSEYQITNRDYGSGPSGAAYTWTLIDGTWTPETTLTGYNGQTGLTGTDMLPNHYFGSSVSVKDGIAVIGCPSDIYDNSGSNALTNAGSVYVYRRTANGASFVWEFDQKLAGGNNDRTSGDKLGAASAVYGNTIAVAAINHPYDAEDSNFFTNAGAVYIWVYDELNNLTFQQKLTAVGTNARNANAYFGSSIALIDDMIAISAPGTVYDTNGFSVGTSYGGVFVFVRTGSNWAIQEWLSAPTLTDTGEITTSTSGNTGDLYGQDIDLNVYNGITRLLIGAPNYSYLGQYYTGAAFSYTYDETNYAWNFENSFNNIFEISDSFGTTVSLMDNIAVIGCPQALNMATPEQTYNPVIGASAVYLYDNTWSILNTLTSPDTDNITGDKLGSSIDIDGTTMVVGAPNNAFAIDGSAQSNAGAAYVYDWTGTEWSFSKKLTAPDVFRNNGDNFGTSVAISGDNIAIGSTSSSSFGNSNTTQIPVTGLTSYYPLNGTPSDTVGNGAEFEGGLSFNSSRPDGTGQALVVSDSVITGPNIKSDTNTLTISFWAQLDNLVLSGSIPGSNIFSQLQSNSTLVYDFCIERAYSGGALNVWVDSKESGTAGITTTNSMIANTWNHIVLSFDATNSKYYLFLNNTKYTGTASWTDLKWISSNASRIGISDSNAVSTNPWSGSFSDLRIYDTLLSDADVATLYSQFTTSNISNAGAVYVYSKGSAFTKKKVRREVWSADTSWTVPSTISDSSVKISMWGGAGGSGANQGAYNRFFQGSSGGFVSFRLPVSSGDTIKGLIGQPGGNKGGAPGVTSGGLYKGGQGSFISTSASGGSGGSASAILYNGSTIAIAAGGGGGHYNASAYAPAMSVPNSTLFTDTTSGQDATTGTTYSLAGGGGGYRGGVSVTPMASGASSSYASTSGLSWIDPSVETYRFGSTQTPQIVDGASTPGYINNAGLAGPGVANAGLVIVEWYEDVAVTDYEYVTQLVPVGTNAHNTNDNFGFAVDIDGTTIVASAPYHDYDENGSSSVNNAGAAWVFELTDGVWTQTSKITGEGTNARNANDNFGYSVGINDGFIIVGAPNHGYDDYGANLVSGNGAAWVFTQTGNTWASVAKLIEFGRDKNTGDKLGASIACDGSICIVGAPGNSYDATLDGSGNASYVNLDYMPSSGAAYIWEWNTSTSAWDFKQKVVASNRYTGEQFGYCVALSNKKILIGSNNQSTTVDSASYLFEKTGTYPSAWVQTNTFTNEHITNYGNNVAIDNNTIAISGVSVEASTTWNFPTFLNGDTAILGNSDFTIEAIVNFNNVSIANGNDWNFLTSSSYSYHAGGGIWGLYISLLTLKPVIDTGIDNAGTQLSYGTHHIAWTRTGGVSTLWVDGVSEYTFSDTKNYTDTGIQFVSGSNELLYGKVTMNEALYTSSFIAPSVLTKDDSTSIFTIGADNSIRRSVLDVYEFSSNAWSLVASFYDQSNITDLFGNSIALNETHGMILVGAPNRSLDDTSQNSISGAGAAFSYLRNTAGSWEANQILVGQGQDSNPGDYIGSSVSADGEVMVIASVNHSYDALGSNYMNGAGAVWIWRYFGSTPTWQLEQKIVPSDRAPGDNFGSSVSISGNTLAVGATEKLSGAGKVYVFNRPSTTSDGTVNCWTETAGLVPTGTNAANSGDKFGFSISLQESTYSLLVGAPYHSYDETGSNSLANAGAAWAFSVSSGTWTQTQKIVAIGVLNGVTVPNARNTNDYFGYSVGLKDNSAIIGATGHSYDNSGTNPLAGSGAAFLYTRTDNTHPWNTVIKLTGTSPDNNPNEEYGISVVATSNTIAVGTPGQAYDGGGNYWLPNAGAVYIWYNDGTSWALQQKISAQDGTLTGNVNRISGDKFGSTLAINGDTLIVGIPSRSTDVTGATAMVNAGAIMIFKRSANTWTNYGSMIQGSDTAAGDQFGFALDYDGTTLVVGAPTSRLDSSGANSVDQAGSIYTFSDNGTAFVQNSKIVPTGTNARTAGSLFGSSVSVKDSILLVGAPNHSYDDTGVLMSSAVGAAWIFNNIKSTWVQVDKVTDFTLSKSASDGFASTSYSFSSNYLVVGAPGYSYDSDMRNYLSGAGAVYIFTRSSSSFAFSQIITPLGTNMRNAGDGFGTTLAIDGTTLVVSSPNISYDSSGVASAGNTGLLFVYDSDGTSFSQTTVLEETGTNANIQGDMFGYNIAIDGDYIVASSINHPYDATGSNKLTGAGAAWIYYKDSTSGWTSVDKIVPSGTNARNANDNFGHCVAIDSTSLVCAVSSIVHGYDAAGLTSIANSGAAWTFTSSSTDNTVWTQKHKLVPTGTERTTSDNFGVAVSYNNGYLAISDENTTDMWYENSITGTGSVNMFKSTYSRNSVLLDGSSGYIDVSSAAKSITDTTWSISAWVNSNSTPTSSVNHTCLYSAMHGRDVMRIYATSDSYINITYGLVTIRATAFITDGNWHNVIISGLGSTDVSDIEVFIDGQSTTVVGYLQPILYPTDYVGDYTMNGVPYDSTSTYSDIQNITYSDASSLQVNRDAMSLTGSIIPSIETSFVSDTSISISFWAYSSESISSTGNTALLTQLISSDGTAGGTSFLLNISCNSTGYIFAQYNNNTSVVSSTAMTVGNWYNIVVSIDTTNKNISLTVNDKTVSTTLSTIGAATDTPILFGSAGTYSSDGSNLAIPNYNNFVGMMTDMRIYDRVLTTSELSNLYSEFTMQPVDNNESILGYKKTEYGTTNKGNTSDFTGTYVLSIPNYLSVGTSVEIICYLFSLDVSNNLMIEASRYDDWHTNTNGSGMFTYYASNPTYTTIETPGLKVGWNKILLCNAAGELFINVNGNISSRPGYSRANTIFTLYAISTQQVIQTIALTTSMDPIEDYTVNSNVTCYVDFSTPSAPIVNGSGITITSTSGSYVGGSIPSAYDATRVVEISTATTTVPAGIVPVDTDSILVGAGHNKDGSVGEMFRASVSDIAIINGSVSSTDAANIFNGGKNSDISGGIVGNWIT